MKFPDLEPSPMRWENRTADDIKKEPYDTILEREEELQLMRNESARNDIGIATLNDRKLKIPLFQSNQLPQNICTDPALLIRVPTR